MEFAGSRLGTTHAFEQELAPQWHGSCRCQSSEKLARKVQTKVYFRVGPKVRVFGTEFVRVTKVVDVTKSADKSCQT